MFAQGAESSSGVPLLRLDLGVMTEAGVGTATPGRKQTPHHLCLVWALWPESKLPGTVHPGRAPFCGCFYGSFLPEDLRLQGERAARNPSLNPVPHTP